jgi:hypothetical protein
VKDCRADKRFQSDSRDIARVQKIAKQTKDSRAIPERLQERERFQTRKEIPERTREIARV